MQLETGMSINRNFPAIGTAGLLRDLVSGNKRVPRPPPRIKEMTRGITYLPEQIAAVGPKLPTSGILQRTICHRTRTQPRPRARSVRAYAEMEHCHALSPARQHH